MNLVFNDKDDAHQYLLNAAEVPSVTTVIGEVVGHIIRASEWHMERGRIHHACYALIAQGIDFKYSDYSEPWIEGCRKFFREVNPEILGVEQLVASEKYQYAGTLDLMVMLNKKLTVLDFKNTASGTDAMQCAGYSIAHEEMKGGKIKQVATVQINGDGGYKMTELVKGSELLRARREFLACRAVYEIKNREGLLK